MHTYTNIYIPYTFTDLPVLNDSKKERPHGNFSLLIIVLTAEWWKGVGPGGG